MKSNEKSTNLFDFCYTVVFFNVQVTALLYVGFFFLNKINVKINHKNFKLREIIVEIMRQILSPSVFEGPFRCSKLCQFTSSTLENN